MQTEIRLDRECGPLAFARARLERVLDGRGPQRIEIYASPAERWPCGAGEQGYQLYRDGETLIVAGADTAGAMYGALDLARHFELGGTAQALEPRQVEAFIKQRGIKFNLPLDARTPSYSDSGDSAQENILQMWDFEFWRGFLDRMALNKYNVLSLWNMSPGPSMVRVPEYPEVALDDVMRAGHPPHATLRGMELYTGQQAGTLVPLKRMPIEEKIRFWRRVMEYAKERCVSVYLFTWNVYVYGTEHTQYGITDRADNPVTRDYVRRTVEALVRTYPLLAGIGVTAGENMRTEWRVDVREDVEWIMDTYGRGIMQALADQPEREFTLIHRSHMTTVEQMEEVFCKFPHRFELSQKYSMAHMYSAIQPHFGDRFFAQLQNGRKCWLTLRDDDFYQLRWGDTGYARAYLDQLPREAVRGFYMGSDGMIWGRDYSPRDPRQQGGYFIDRHWFSFAVWGELSYNRELPDSYFRGLLAQRYGTDADRVFEAMRLSSCAIPLQQRVYWHDFDFQWVPEACCSYLEAEDLLIFHTLEDFIAGSACPKTGYLSIAEYGEGLAAGQLPAGITPDAVADEMRHSCREALGLLGQVTPPCDPGDQSLLEDLEAMAQLGLYYADKLQAAVALLLYRKTGEVSQQQRAVSLAQEGLGHWLSYSSSVARRYRPQRYGRLRQAFSPDLFDGYAQFDITIAGADWQP